MKRAVFVVLVLAGATSSAQTPAGAPANPFGDRPATARRTSRWSRASARRPRPLVRSLTVTVEVSPRRTMHVYAPGKHDYQVVALTLTPAALGEAGADEVPAVGGSLFRAAERDGGGLLEAVPPDPRDDRARHARSPASRSPARSSVTVCRPARISGVRRQGLLLAGKGAGPVRASQIK